MPEVQETAPQNAAPSTNTQQNSKPAAQRGGVTMLTIYACAAIGGTIAAIADLVQKEKASAVLKMTTISARHLDLAVPPLYIFLVVVFLGVLLCFVFQPSNRRAGFAVGAGVIASIMTVTPYQPLQTGQPSEAGETTWHFPAGSNLQLASSDIAVLRLAGTQTDMAVIPVTNDLAIPVEVKVSFYDRNNRRAYEQVQAISAGATRTFEFAAQSRNGQVNGELFLEVAGERSGFVSVSGPAPYHSNTLSLTRSVPAFAKAQINQDALNTFSQTTGPTPRPAKEAEVRAIYNKPTGIIDQLQRQLLSPRKW
ncbi:hypothetical protein [Roseibium sediminicola]|uniref:Uncharacterized protein n=1 Tax=Roseibium sediminicola TaxID=2933272 RepID=A0ABT0GRK5_9HYPH|nr:hypothetical protein [Roseibium sp. CAU 1639]MCK7612081.1 hypothetical protein [Roseibium sp. CAU 1639]